MPRFAVAMMLLIAGCGRFGFGGDDTSGTDAVVSPGCIRTATAYGDQVCAVRTDGAVYCWGGNGGGGLGDGTFTEHYTPMPAMINDVVDITSGEDTVCAVKSDRSLWCWGFNMQGQVGDNSTMNRAVPVHVSLPGRVAMVRGAQTHTCAVLEDGRGYCWGSNTFFEMGDMVVGDRLVPGPAPIGGNLNVALGDDVTCILRPDSSVACWGKDTEGDLGDGMTTTRATAMRIGAVLDPVVSVAGGCHRHYCVATSIGDVWCWGENTFGEVGKGSTSMYETLPVRVAGVSGAVQVTVGASHSCARTSAGDVWCWGRGTTGELGNGAFDDHLAPVRVTGLTGQTVDLQATCASTLVRRADGTLAIWGGFPTLGTGSTLNSAVPVDVPVPCP